MTRPRSAAAALALASVLLFSAACSSGEEEPATGAPSAAVSAPTSASTPAPGATGTAAPATGAPAGSVPIPAGSGPAGGNAQAVCDTVTKDSSTAVTEYVGQLSKLAQAGPDTPEGRTAQAAAEKALDDWEASLRAQAGSATDARLKAVLTNMASQVGTMTADLNAIGGGQVEQLQAMLDELCGG
ncbi:hypothetical protein [Catenuloplanes atrovinosus]|uniref:Lipoprotein n=1 Tax=Catenuloplanes atrovinosus TaxID=137266 RepID=A0AAE3YUJ8_9ACTN|nr:hypothetical protein [Catenuloplanes atrovinosus]MDR7278643.1 hypothetical protein [Catenuloplanes atrovinosus]